MKSVFKRFAPVLILAIVAVASYAVLTHANLPVFERFGGACSKPIAYGVGAYDPRFGISEAEFKEAIERAADVWNDAAGRPLFTPSTLPTLTLNLAYDERQQALELGGAISAEQHTYEQMRDAVDVLRYRYNDLQAAYEASLRVFEAETRAYDAEVAEWNAKGGAPPEEYARLAVRKAAIEERQMDLRRQTVAIQSAARDINAQVEALNVIVKRLNTDAETFNETLGHDFDQGNYVTTDEGSRITIFTFENKQELTRVLVHELGHALGIGHLENPESIMYSYSIGESLKLSEEDLAALREVCGS